MRSVSTLELLGGSKKYLKQLKRFKTECARNGFCNLILKGCSFKAGSLPFLNRLSNYSNLLTVTFIDCTVLFCLKLLSIIARSSSRISRVEVIGTKKSLRDRFSPELQRLYGIPLQLDCKRICFRGRVPGEFVEKILSNRGIEDVTLDESTIISLGRKQKLLRMLKLMDRFYLGCASLDTSKLGSIICSAGMKVTRVGTVNLGRVIILRGVLDDYPDFRIFQGVKSMVVADEIDLMLIQKIPQNF